MTRRQFWIVMIALVAVALIVFVPLGVALPSSGLAARAARGTIWSGRLIDARVGNLAVGDVDVAVSPLPLLAGRTRADLRGPLGQGTVILSSSGSGIDKATAKLATAGLFAAVPLDGVDLDAMSVQFRGNRCESAEGRVKASFSGEVAGLALSQGLSGTARCEGGMLLIPLVSQSAMERLNMRIAGDGSYRAEFIVRATDPTLNAKLLGAGFVSSQAGYVLRLTGAL
jgi:general secretion pathway protein N